LDPTSVPTEWPTLDPTQVPSESPTPVPTSLPTVQPTDFPTNEPSHQPSEIPTYAPSHSPTTNPSFAPTLDPTLFPSNLPTLTPTSDPTIIPTVYVNETELAIQRANAERLAQKAAEQNPMSGENEAVFCNPAVARVVAPIILLLGLVGFGGLVDKIRIDLGKNGKLHHFDVADWQCILVFVDCTAIGLLLAFTGYATDWWRVGGLLHDNMAAKTAMNIILYTLPENVSFWSYTILIFHWAGILYGGPKKGARANSALGGLRTLFLIINVSLSIESILSWILVVSLTDVKAQNMAAFSHQLLFSFTSLVLAVSVLFFGISLAKTITKSSKKFSGNDQAAKRNRKAARKAAVVAIVFAIVWLLSTLLRFVPAIGIMIFSVYEWFSIKNPIMYYGNYYVLRIIATCIILFMYGPFKGLSDWLGEKCDSLFKMVFKEKDEDTANGNGMGKRQETQKIINKLATQESKRESPIVLGVC